MYVNHLHTLNILQPPFITKPIIGLVFYIILAIINIDGDLMKRLKVLLLSLLLLPMNVLAYSEYIIPGGETLGIEINSDGIMVIGFYQINGKYNKGDPNIKSGDYITKVNNIEVNTVDELTDAIEDNVSTGYVNVTYVRNGKEKVSELELIKDGDIYKTGLYVKDTITGIGTLSYIDPETKVFGALGHEIVESNTNSIVEIKSGMIVRNFIIGIDKSSSGVPGSKNAKFYYNHIVDYNFYLFLFLSSGII